jgi:hypothetical protein
MSYTLQALAYCNFDLNENWQFSLQDSEMANSEMEFGVRSMEKHREQASRYKNKIGSVFLSYTINTYICVVSSFFGMLEFFSVQVEWSA